MMDKFEAAPVTAGLRQDGIATNQNQNQGKGLTIAADTSASSQPMAPAMSACFDGSPVPTFSIDMDHVVTNWNKACEEATGRSSIEMVGSRNHWQPFYPEQRPLMIDLIADGSVDTLANNYYQNKFKPSPLIPGAYEAEDFFPHLGKNGRWLFFSAAPLRDSSGRIIGAIETLQDVTARKVAEQKLLLGRLELEQLVADRTADLAGVNVRLGIDIRDREAAEVELLRSNAELTELNAKLSTAQQQLLQSEKLASIGQLAAGVAHEINNPIGYIFSNFNTLETYIENLLAMLKYYEDAEADITQPDVVVKLHAMRESIELNYLKEDIPVLMRESKEGIVRVRKIVQDLKDFSRIDGGQDWQWANLNQGIESTLNVVNNEVRYKADIVREYGAIPDIECLPSQINQVILNMMVNAAHSIGTERGTITIRTGTGDAMVWIEISDTGAGIPKEIQSRIFDPFFTTKPVGKGTGLGLSLSYGIVQKHQGRIEVESEVGKGTCFRITLPIQRACPDSDDKDASR
jgi:two-component system NtrC family sensor kinase